MDRQAFKLRMQNLKSYRELNPGKGYWDFMELLAEFKAKEWGESNSDLVLTQMLNDNTYNYKQMYEENPSMKPEEGHFTDRYKTFYHPTFSNESMYSGKKSLYNPDGYVGGTWDEENKVFHLGKGLNREYTQEYLDRADPGYKAYQPGGETGDDKYNQLLSKLPQSKIGTEEKEWLRNWYQKRREYAKKHPYIANNMNQQLDVVLERFNVDPYTLNYYFEDGMQYPLRLAGYLNSVPIKIYEGNIPGEDPGLTGSYDPLAWYGDNIKLSKNRDKTTLLHELDHVLNVNNKPLLDNVRDRLGKQVMINDKYQVPFEENSKYEYYDDYLLDPAELHSRLTEFRYLNNLDPTKEYKLLDVKEWRKNAKDRELLDLLPDDNTILELINTVASTDNKKSEDRVPMAKDGLQTGDDPGSASLEQIEQREWLRNWLRNRTALMTDNIDTYANQVYYGSSHDRNHVLPFFFQNKEKNAANVILEQLLLADKTPVYDYREPWTVNLGNPYEDYFFGLPATLLGAFLKEPGKERAINISPITKDRSAILHELSHATQDKYEILTSKIAEILKKHGKELPTHDKYYDNPNEIYSRMNLFRHDNGLKPSDIVTEELIEQWKKSSIDNKFIKRYSTNTLLDLLNTVADANSRSRSDEVPMAEYGLESDNVPSPIYPEFVNGLRVNRWTGQPIATGNLDPVFSARNAADFTPVGDALAANDAYHAVLNRDWLGAGLSALAMVPYIPMVNKNYVSDAIERMLSKNARNAHKATELNNETYEVVQRLTDDPSYMERANLVKELFGDDYTKVYADLIDAYNNNPDLLPKAKATEFDTRANGRMAATADAAKRHEEGGDFPGLGEYEYLFAKDVDLPEGITVHENNHLTDFLKNKTKHADGNSNMFHLMSKDLKSGIDKMDRYYSNLSELKAYMNQVREYMYKKGIISSRNAKVDANELKKIIKHLPPYMNAAKRASQQFKSMKSYAKWFNSVPLLGLGTLIMNRSQAKQENTNI